MRKFRINKRVVSEDSRPYIIAEIGVNHGGSIKKARMLVRLAKEGGADAVKFQTYKAETLACKSSPSYWDLAKEPTRSQYMLFKKYDSFNKKDFFELGEYAKKIKIDFLSTPFDDDSVDFLAPIIPCFKIASADITNTPFLRKIASKRMPVILSTGASTLSEINSAIKELEVHGAESIALLHCILNYPTAYENAHLNVIKNLLKRYPNKVIGYSDHCLPDDSMLVLTAAYFFGARILEKHFTYDKSLQGNDHYHAMDIKDLKKFVNQLDFARKLEGTHNRKPLPTEGISRKNARRSIVTKTKIKAGARLTENSLTCKRPGTGISPLYWDRVIGKKAKRDLEEDFALSWADIV